MCRYEKMLFPSQRKQYRCGIFVEKSLDNDKQADNCQMRPLP